MSRCTACLAVTALLAASGGSYREAIPGYQYSFPRDHFNHPEFRTEWWYYTGNVHNARGHRFGFELVFFRQAQRRGPSGNPSAWRIDDLYLAHLALTDIDSNRFRYYRRLNRAGPGIAGISFEKRRIWNGNWSVQWSRERQILEATAEEVRFALDLNPLKQPVIHGQNGVSQKSARTASYYVSFTRLAVTGWIEVRGSRTTVEGTAWMDHEWFSHELEEAQTGWDWFSMQLADETELMLFELRRKDGSIDPYSSGTYVDRSGRARHLSRSDFTLVPVSYWISGNTKARYPVRWNIRVPALGISLDCSATIDGQELVSTDAAGPTYWEGSVVYSGSSSGMGYLEMTGYDKPVRLN